MNLRQCRGCKQYDSWNEKCFLGHDIPEYGYTEACADYEEQFKIEGTKYCDDCVHYNLWESPGGSGCKKHYEIPESRHACDEFEEE